MAKEIVKEEITEESIKAFKNGQSSGMEICSNNLAVDARIAFGKNDDEKAKLLREYSQKFFQMAKEKEKDV